MSADHVKFKTPRALVGGKNDGVHFGPRVHAIRPPETGGAQFTQHRLPGVQQAQRLSNTPPRLLTF